MIGIAVIGAGHWGPNLIAAFEENPRSKVRWVVDTDEKRLSGVASRYESLSISTEPDEALEDEAVDAVVVATPISTHYSLSSLALKHGKHVLVEKPLAHSSAAARRLTELATANDLVLLVGHVFLYNPAVIHAKDVIDAGQLGSIHYLSMVRTNLGPIRVDVDVAWDLLSHDISIADYWLGERPTGVSAVAGNWINEGIADAIFATLEYPNGVLVNAHCSWLSPRKVRGITVVGERGMVTIDDMDPAEPLRIYDKRVGRHQQNVPFVNSYRTFRASIFEGAVTIPRIPFEAPVKREVDHFLECIESGSVPRTNALVGTDVVITLEAIQASMANRGTWTPVA